MALQPPRRCRRLLVVITSALLVVSAITAARAQQPAARPNVLFIMADDLRTELGSYGSPALTPNIDHLAARGLTFTNAYCQQALCNPSRSSMLTGLRPDTLGLWSNSIHFRELKPDVVTLPEHFKAAGYVTRDVGKIFHNFHTKVKGDPQSWSAPEFLHYASHGDDKPIVDGEPPQDIAKAPRCERRDVPDAAYYDGRVADEAVRVMEEIKGGPFFLAVGFWKPHAPFNAPHQYWSLYDRTALPRVDTSRPANAPEVAFHDGRELRGLPPNQLDFTPEQIAEIRHGYFAGTSFMDTQVGKVLAALERNGLADSTIVVFCADHGYHLGEHGLWAKTSCFDLDAHVPLMIAPPRFGRAGVKNSSPVELLDLYPTLVDLCGLPKPKHLEGKSLAPIFTDPTAALASGAFTQHPRPAYFDRTEKGVPEAMGYSVRTDRVRYTEWRDWDTGDLVGRELYDHTKDPAETRNVVDSVEMQAPLDEAAKLLNKQFPR